MTSRRPSTASTDANSSRIPFASSEALLWGPEMKQQHAYLLTEMRALQRQHEAYDARIQQTEAAAEAAEAATSRIRHLEQQLAAIEAEDDDKVWEKWASGELTQLRIFVDTNKHVRQKQIELSNDMSRIEEDLDKMKSSPTDLKAVLRRLDLLETGCREDARHIKSLEGEVNRLKTLRQSSSTSAISSRSNPYRNKGVRRTITPSQLSHAEISDGEATTEDEDLIPPRGPTREEIQVPRSPESRER
jgi:DNA repair exonuclease SbcCD ATPase subunit